jgi:FkbM family methyltransferase
MYFGLFEKDLLAYMHSVLRLGDTFVDVGANIGYVSAYARQQVGSSGRVYCFEPVPEYAAMLEASVQSALVKNVIVVQQAAGDRQGTVPIKVSGKGNIGWNTIVPGFMGESSDVRTFEVPMTTLACYFKNQNIVDVRLVKIDVEGAELLVLRGLIPWLAKGRRPRIVTEICPQACAMLGSSTTEIFAMMESYGYRGFVFSRRGFRKLIAGIVRLDPITPEEITRTTDVVWEPR